MYFLLRKVQLELRRDYVVGAKITHRINKTPLGYGCYPNNATNERKYLFTPFSFRRNNNPRGKISHSLAERYNAAFQRLTLETKKKKKKELQMVREWSKRRARATGRKLRKRFAPDFKRLPSLRAGSSRRPRARFTFINYSAAFVPAEVRRAERILITPSRRRGRE